MKKASILVLITAGFAFSAVAAPSYWNSTNRNAKVSQLIPGRNIPDLPPGKLFADWTRLKSEQWLKTKNVSKAENYELLANVSPADVDIIRDFPRHISPFGRIKNMKTTGLSKDALKDIKWKNDNVFINYCPFCGSKMFKLKFDEKNLWHATTTCCKTDLYGKEKDFPPNYTLKPTATVPFPRMDNTTINVPCLLYKDKNGVEWELFIKTIFCHEHWLAMAKRVEKYQKEFIKTGNPLYPYKIAVILDQVADTYYGLPLCHKNSLAKGKDGKPLTRKEWESISEPAIFKHSSIGPWNRRKPFKSTKGWLNMSREDIWVEPFARTRHHPAFKFYSMKKYGDPNALDKKIMDKLLRDIARMFKTAFSQKLLTNYQEANYVGMWLLGTLLNDKELVDFAAPNQELTLYNHHYHDGMNGEGAPNYMEMLHTYYYPKMKNKNGCWLQLYPEFHSKNPFFQAASTELNKMTTARGLKLEFGDQHEYALREYKIDQLKLAKMRKAPSHNWPGFGVGILRAGDTNNRLELSMHYSRATLHNASDALGISMWFDGIPIIRPGGYAAWWCNVLLDSNAPEIDMLNKMGYPKKIIQADRGFNARPWQWAHSAQAQNTVTVNNKGVGRGWADNRGSSEVIAFNNDNPTLQVLDVADIKSFDRVGVKCVKKFRRTLLTVNTSTGKPYAIDIVTLDGGKSQALFHSIWGERVETNLPTPIASYDNLASAWFSNKTNDKNSANCSQIRNVEQYAKTEQPWSITWKTDYYAYGPRNLSGTPMKSPPKGLDIIYSRMTGLPLKQAPTTIWSGKAPWIAWIKQPLHNNIKLNGNVAFIDAMDMIIERRIAAKPTEELNSRFVHILECWREKSKPVIKSANYAVISNASNTNNAVAIRINLANGNMDTIIFQEKPGNVELADNMETDALYALFRQNKHGELIAAHSLGGNYLRFNGFNAKTVSSYGGEIVDIIGDITGTRQESALIIKPDRPWPTGKALSGRELTVRIKRENGHANNEGYKIAKTSLRPDGLVRIDLENKAPFIVGWHQVTKLDPKRPNVARTCRPMVAYANQPWYEGVKVWFPQKGKTYTIKDTEQVGGGTGGSWLELAGDVDLQKDGIKPGDWYVIYAIEPGQRVNVFGSCSFSRK